MLAETVQACIHSSPSAATDCSQICCLSGKPLIPPGAMGVCCSLLVEDGFAIDSQPGAAMTLNPSELALL